MITEQSKADAISVHQAKPVAKQAAKQVKEVTPPFRALGIPALAAASRRSPEKSIERNHDLPHFLRQPQQS